MSIAQQASAVEAARRIISGQQAMKPSRKEVDYLCAQLEQATVTLRWLERNEAAIKKKVEAA